MFLIFYCVMHQVYQYNHYVGVKVDLNARDPKRRSETGGSVYAAVIHPEIMWLVFPMKVKRTMQSGQRDQIRPINQMLLFFIIIKYQVSARQCHKMIWVIFLQV